MIFDLALILCINLLALCLEEIEEDYMGDLCVGGKEAKRMGGELVYTSSTSGLLLYGK